MNLQAVVDSLRQHFEQFEASAKEKLEQDLPVLADLAQKAASNVALSAIMSAAHLQEVPEFLQTIADLVTKADAALESAHASGVAEGTAAAAAPAPAGPDPAGPEG